MAPRTRSRSRWILGALALSGAWVSDARAADDPPPPPPPLPRGVKSGGDRAGERMLDPSSPEFRGAVLGDLSKSENVGGERVVWAVGGVSQPVWIKFPGFELRCESAVIWGDRERLTGALERRKGSAVAEGDDILGNAIHAVYAEGDVFVRRDKYTFHANRVLLDFQHDRAHLVDVVVQGAVKTSGQHEAPLSIRAAVVRGVAKDKFRAEDATFTSCTYEHPHLAFHTSWVEVDFSKKEPEYETSWWPTVRADTAAGRDIPLLPIPKIGGGSGNMPVQSIEFSNSNRFGVTMGLGFGGRMKRDDGSTWGSWQVTPRYRTRRGEGLGVALDHEGLPTRPGGRADQLSFDGSYQRDGQDKDSFSDRPFDGRLGGKSLNDRGRADVWYRHYMDSDAERGLLGNGWRLDLSGHWFSDRGYVPEYNSDDATQGVPFETYAQLRKTWDTQGVSILGSYRPTDEAATLVRRTTDPALTGYVVQTDYLPAAGWHLFNQPIVSREATGFAPLNLSAEASVAQVERRYDDFLEDDYAATLGWRSKRVLREDVEARVTAPFEVGSVQVTPAVGGSLYHVSDANGFANAGTPAAGESEGRSSAFWSLRMGTEAHRTMPDACSEFFDLHGLRHVVSADATWLNRFQVSDQTPYGFQTNDLHDQLFEENVVSFRLRNRLQTKRDGELVDWIDYEARFLYYVDETEAFKGTGLSVREDFASPLDQIDFPGESKYLSATRDGSAFHQHRARVELLPQVWLVGEADYDMTRSRMETSAAGFRWFPDKRFSIYAGRRVIHDDSAVWTVRGDYRMSEKWGFTGDFQRDAKSDRGLRTRVGLYRRAHDYTIAIEFESERFLKETNFAFVIYPHEWMVRKNDPFSSRRPLDFEALRWYR
ncbi:MAG: hypothetical protein K8T90_00675 [Planctomycetes bacterium]|nr:hypothetical protein [Planctomycetota bacterium]